MFWWNHTQLGNIWGPGCHWRKKATVCCWAETCVYLKRKTGTQACNSEGTSPKRDTGGRKESVSCEKWRRSITWGTVWELRLAGTPELCLGPLSEERRRTQLGGAGEWLEEMGWALNERDKDGEMQEAAAWAERPLASEIRARCQGCTGRSRNHQGTSQGAPSGALEQALPGQAEPL